MATDNLETFHDTASDNTSGASSAIMSEVNNDRAQTNTSKSTDYLSSAENKVKELFGSLSFSDDSSASSSSDKAATSDKAAAPAGSTDSPAPAAADNIAAATPAAEKVTSSSTDSTQPSSTSDASIDQLKAARDTAQNDAATAGRPGADGTPVVVNQADATKSATDIEDGLHWYKADEFDKINASLANKSPEEIKAIDEAFKKEHGGKGIEETLNDRWKDHPKELAEVKALLHPKEVTQAKSDDTPAQVKEKEDRNLDSIKHDTEVQAKHQELAQKARETMQEPALTKFLTNIDNLEKRESQVQVQYQKELEAGGMAPEQAAREAEAKAHKQLKDTFDNTEKLLAHNPSAKTSDKDRVQLAQEVMKHAADPTTISQGNYPTCTLAVTETRAWSKDPAESSRLIAEVAITGKYTRPGHPDIVLDPQSLTKQGDAKQPDSDEKVNQRDFASQLFEVTAANVGLEKRNASTNPPGHLKYEQHKPGADGVHNPEDTGERLIDYGTHPPKIVDKGISLTPDEIGYAAKEISPENAKGIVMIDNWDLTRLDKSIVNYDLQKYGVNGGAPVDLNDPNWVKKAHDGVNSNDRMTAEQKKELNKNIDDLDKNNKLDHEGNVLHVHNEQEMKDALAKLSDSGKLPVVVAVDTGNEPFFTDSKAGLAGGSGSAHVITITSYDKATGVAKMDNQWDGVSDHSITAKQLFEATRNPKLSMDDMKREVAADRASGHRDYIKEYELLRLQKDNHEITDAEYDRQMTQETIDRYKDWKAGRVTDEDYQRATNECVLMLKPLENGSAADKARLAKIKEDVKRGMAA